MLSADIPLSTDFVLRQNREMCPITVSLVEALPRQHKHAFFSALAPGTHVVKHNGESDSDLFTRHVVWVEVENQKQRHLFFGTYMPSRHFS